MTALMTNGRMVNLIPLLSAVFFSFSLICQSSVTSASSIAETWVAVYFDFTIALAMDRLTPLKGMRSTYPYRSYFLTFAGFFTSSTGFALPSASCLTSFSNTRPSDPVPCTLVISTPNSLARARTAGVASACSLTDLPNPLLLGHDLQNDPCPRRGNLRKSLVGLYLDQGLSLLNPIPFFDQPADNLAFG